MNIWLHGDFAFKEPTVLNTEAKNLIIVGSLSSNEDIALSVNNLVVLGKIISTKGITIKTKQSFFNVGHIQAVGDINISSQDSIFQGPSDKAIEKIRALGVDLSKNPSGGLTVLVPKYPV